MSSTFSNDNRNPFDLPPIPPRDILPSSQQLDDPETTGEGEKEKEAWPTEEEEA